MKKTKMEEKPKDMTVLVENFFDIGRPLRAYHLGWHEDDRIEAKSSVSKKIFNFYYEMCFNIVFYYVKDGCFYGIHSEITPTPVFRFKQNLEKEIVKFQIEGDTHDYMDGEILYMLEDGQSAWDTIKIGGASMEEIIQNSFIVSIL